MVAGLFGSGGSNKRHVNEISFHISFLFVLSHFFVFHVLKCPQMDTKGALKGAKMVSGRAKVIPGCPQMTKVDSR